MERAETTQNVEKLEPDNSQEEEEEGMFDDG